MEHQDSRRTGPCRPVQRDRQGAWADQPRGGLPCHRQAAARSGGYGVSGLAGDWRFRNPAEGPADPVHYLGRLPEALRLQECRVIGREDRQRDSGLRRDEAASGRKLRHGDSTERRRMGGRRGTGGRDRSRQPNTRPRFEGRVMAEAISKVGIISCSGEEIPEGTIARQAVRRRPGGFASAADGNPVLAALSGRRGRRAAFCQRASNDYRGRLRQALCANGGPNSISGRVSASLVVSDILGDRAKGCHRSARDADQADEQAVWIVAERIAAEVDALTASGAQGESSMAPAAGNGVCCSCGSPSPEGTLEVSGKAVTVNGLPLIFQHLRKKGLQPGDGSADTLLETVRIYHAIEPGEEAAYRQALADGYQRYCQRRS